MIVSFKPCYKWNAFNTVFACTSATSDDFRFKPCYKWNAFNTLKEDIMYSVVIEVLNLVISGMPSIHLSPSEQKSVS